MPTMILRNVPEELHRELKMLSAKTGKPMNTLVIEAIADKVEKEGKD